MQCDEGKPGCRRCVKSGFACTGYDETQSEYIVSQDVVKGYEEGADQAFLANRDVARDQASIQASSLRSLPVDAEDLAISFYFDQLAPRQYGSWVDVLQFFYAGESSDSILCRAVTAMSCSFISLEPAFTQYKVKAFSEYTKVVRLIRDELNNPSIVFKDAFLIALLTLGNWEVCTIRTVKILL